MKIYIIEASGIRSDVYHRAAYGRVAYGRAAYGREAYMSRGKLPLQKILKTIYLFEIEGFCCCHIHLLVLVAHQGVSSLVTLLLALGEVNLFLFTPRVFLEIIKRNYGNL